MSLPRPFYEDEAVTIYHGAVCGIMALCQKSHRLVIGRGFAARTFRSCRQVRLGATNRNLSMWRNVSGLALPIVSGRVMRRLSDPVEVGRYACTQTSALA